MSDDEWRFSTDEVGATDDDGGTGPTTDTTGDDAGRPSAGEGVLGTTDAAFENPEPQPIAVENVLFVLVGVATMVGIVALLIV